MGNLFVSIIIPTYKPKDYIVRCIESLANQSLSKDKFELVIVLNGPKNDYDKFVEEILVNKELQYELKYINDTGVSHARNYGLEKAKGDFVLFLDDDDFLSEDFLANMYQTFLNNQNCDLIVSDFRCINDEGVITNDYMSSTFSKMLECDRQNYSVIKYRKFLSSACGKLIKRDTINNKRFEPGLKISEDALFMFTISKNMKNIVLLKEDAYYYRVIRNNSSSRKEISLGKEVKNWSNSVYFFTKTYLSSPMQYSFLFYLNRVVALTKFLMYRLLK